MARILGVDLPRNKAMRIAMTYLYGVGPKVSVDVLNTANVSLEKSTNDVSDEEIQEIRKALEAYKVEGDLRKDLSLNIKRLRDINCYRGTRHKRSLPCRGQRTHTNARTRKGKAVAIAGKKSIKAMK